MTTAYSNKLPIIKSVTKYTYILDDGTELLDASCGAVTSCFGHAGREVADIRAAANGEVVPYAPSKYVSSQSTLELEEKLFQSANGEFAGRWTYASGTFAFILLNLALINF